MPLTALKIVKEEARKAKAITNNCDIDFALSCLEKIIVERIEKECLDPKVVCNQCGDTDTKHVEVDEGPRGQMYTTDLCDDCIYTERHAGHVVVQVKPTT